VAPTVRSFSAAFEPLDLVAQFPERYPGLLESGAAVMGGHGARYDILPFASGQSLRLDSQRVLSGEYANGGGFLDALEAWWSALQLPAVATEPAAPLPFTGGWLLYLGYELAAEIEPCLRLPSCADPLIALAVRTPAAWIRDRAAGKAWLLAEAGCESMLDEFEERVRRLRATPPEEELSFAIEEDDPAAFLNAVQRALEYTAAGDVYQTNLSRLWQGRAAHRVRPVDVYRRLRRSNPSPYAALLCCPDFALLSSSPERLVAIRGSTVATRPIAGTRPRGATAADDEALIRSLLANEKERAEHVMLIDLERNDLGRVCRGGSVHVDEFMSVETYSHVHHIVSNVSGRLRENVTPIGVIRALFPGGTITGCPKVRCMQIIAELEDCSRGAYTGSIGYLNRDGSCDLNILIRTMSVQGASIRFRAGAGIVADSIPAQELAETRAKAEGLLRALDVPR
jgi:anthranilate synthase component 1